MASVTWRELCDFVEEDDGLPSWREAHAWTRDKLHYWFRYLAITTSALGDRTVSQTLAGARNWTNCGTLNQRTRGDCSVGFMSANLDVTWDTSISVMRPYEVLTAQCIR